MSLPSESENSRSSSSDRLDGGIQIVPRYILNREKRLLFCAISAYIGTQNPHSIRITVQRFIIGTMGLSPRKKNNIRVWFSQSPREKICKPLQSDVTFLNCIHEAKQLKLDFPGPR